MYTVTILQEGAKELVCAPNFYDNNKEIRIPFRSAKDRT